MVCRMLKNLGFAAALLACLGLSSLVSAQQSITDTQRGEIEQIVRDYLLKNPEVLLEVMEELERRQKAAAQHDSRQRIQQYQAALFQAPHDFVANPDGAVPVVEFFDYQCGFCKRILPAMLRLQAEGKNARVIFKELPILGEMSVYATRAAYAARKQGRYMEMHNALMGVQGRLDEAIVHRLAGDLGLDVARLRQDMQDPEIQEAIEANLELARALGIRGTPTIVIGDTLVPGAIEYDAMTQLISEAESSCMVC